MLSISLILLVGVLLIFHPYSPAAPSSGLYFTVAGTVYLPGQTVLITEIGAQLSPTDPGTSLVCVTSNVNTQCCRGADNPNGGAVGEWFFNGIIFPRNDVQEAFSRSGFTHQVRLNRRNNAMSPTGAYECRVPPLGGGELVTASITITSC